MNWFTRKDKNIQDSNKKELPSDLWKKCNCGEILYSPELESANFICHHCNFHFPISSQKYIDIILDDGGHKTELHKKNETNFALMIIYNVNLCTSNVLFSHYLGYASSFLGF